MASQAAPKPAPGTMPTGVRLKYADGKVVECDLKRQPHRDKKRQAGRVAYYDAHPSGDVDPSLTYELEVDVWPSMTGIHVVFPDNVKDGDLLGLMDTSLMDGTAEE